MDTVSASGSDAVTSLPTLLRIGAWDETAATRFHVERLGLLRGVELVAAGGCVGPDPRTTEHHRPAAVDAGPSAGRHGAVEAAGPDEEHAMPFDAIVCGDPHSLPATPELAARIARHVVLVGDAALFPPRWLAVSEPPPGRPCEAPRVWVCSPALAERTFWGAASCLAAGRIGPLRTLFRAASLNHAPAGPSERNLQAPRSAASATLRRRLAMVLQQAVWLLGGTVPLRAEATQRFDGGLAVALTRPDGLAAHVVLDVAATLHLDTGWLLSASQGGYANLQETRREPDGETYSVPLEVPADPWQAVHASLIEQMSHAPPGVCGETATDAAAASPVAQAGAAPLLRPGDAVTMNSRSGGDGNDRGSRAVRASDAPPNTGSGLEPPSICWSLEAALMAARLTRQLLGGTDGR